MRDPAVIQRRPDQPQRRGRNPLPYRCGVSSTATCWPVRSGSS